MSELRSVKLKTDALLKRLDRLVDHPDAILRIRRLILSLAIHGRLVENNPNDKPAAVSFPRIALAAAEPEDDNYPAHWLRVPLGQMGEWRGGGTPSKSRPEFWQGKLPWVSPKDMKLLRISDAQDHISKAAVEHSAVRLIPEGSLLMVVRGMILARAFPVAVTAREVTINQDMKALLPAEPSTTDFLFVALRAFEPVVLAAIERSTHGTCKLETETLHALVMPLPPLAEQKRIVAKVDELMALCDRLETQLQERDTRQAALARAALARFAHAPTPANLDLLFHDSFTITPADLRKTILNLAVQGHLVPQHPKDEDALTSLARLGITPSAGYRSAPADDSALPPSWTRVHFEDVAVIAGGVTLGRKIVGKKTISLPYLRVANVKRGEIDLSVVKDVTIAEDELERYALRPNDLLMTEGGDWDKVGRAAIWKGQIAPCLHQNHIFRARMRSSELLPRWFVEYFNSPDGRSYFESAAKQTTNLASINMRQVRTCLTPFPPLAEQRRIVAKVDQLMTLVDQWESQLAAARATADHLLSALVSELARGS